MQEGVLGSTRMGKGAIVNGCDHPLFPSGSTTSTRTNPSLIAGTYSASVASLVVWTTIPSLFMNLMTLGRAVRAQIADPLTQNAHSGPVVA